MNDQARPMTDIAFDLKGSALPVDYAFALWSEVVRYLPWLEAEPFAGIHPLRLSPSSTGLLLPQRAKLLLRLPASHVEQAGLLSGQQLTVGDGVLHIGDARERPLFAHSTLHAHVVESASDEEGFLATVVDQLRQLKISAAWICGKHHTMKGAKRTITGYSLVLHDLKLSDSLQLQYRGLGGERHFGYGILIPYKAISSLG